MKALIAWIGIAAVAAAAEMPPLPLNSTVQADAYRPSFTPELLAIAQKFQAAAQAEREWFLAYVKGQETRLRPGEILPYHEKFGVTEEEYQKFTTAAGKPQIEFFGRREVRFSSNKESTTMQIAGATPVIGEVIFDRATQTLSCALGRSNPAKPVEVMSGGALGPWSGVSFDFPLPEGAVVSHGRIAVGKIKDGDVFLHLDLHLISNGERKDIDVIYRWKD
jgi:hypothetical protein